MTKKMFPDAALHTWVLLAAIALALAALPRPAAAQSETNYGRRSTSFDERPRSSRGESTNERLSRGQKSRREKRPPNAVTSAKPLQKMTKGAPVAPVAAGAGTQGNVPAIMFPANAVRASLFFRPLDLKVQTGESFALDLMLNNQTTMRPDGFDVSIAYDPRRLAFKGYDATCLGPYLADPKTDFAVKREPGRLDFSGRLVGAPADYRVPLVTLAFAARDTLGRTALRFLTPPDGASAVYSRGVNIIGRQDQDLKGVLDALVFVNPLPEPAAETDESTSTLPEIGESSLDAAETGWGEIPSGAKLGAPAWIGLQGPESLDLSQGEDFWVDLVLYNPEQVPIESIGVVAGFDPRVLEVIDEDQDNWIANGVNVWDGAFHEDYAFDFFGGDSADNVRGRIYYSMARHTGNWIFPTGVFARIHFRAIASAPATSVALLTKSEGPAKQSYVRAYGTDRQSIAGQRPGTATRVVLRVAPASADSHATSPDAVTVSLE